MFFYNPFKGLKDIPKKNLEQLSLVMCVGVSLVLLCLLSLFFI